MKKLLYILSIFLFLQSCSDVLEEEPLTELTPGGFYTTKAGMESLVNSCYSFARWQAQGGSLDAINLNEAGTDINMDGGGGLNFDGYLFNSSTNQFRNLWNNNYTAINATNNVVAYISSVEGMTEEVKKIREAEARFLRAYYYYQLVMHFGSIHLSLEATEGVETEANRTSVDQVFDAIVEDLEFAIANLPDVQDTYGRADAFAAKHFMARVLLSDETSGPAEFQRAADLAVDVIENSTHSLEPTRAAVFDENNEKNNEILWSVQFPADEAIAGNNGNWMHLHFISRYEVGHPGIIRSLEYQRPWKVSRPSQYLIDLYDETMDSRYLACQCGCPGRKHFSG